MFSNKYVKEAFFEELAKLGAYITHSEEEDLAPGFPKFTVHGEKRKFTMDDLKREIKGDIPLFLGLGMGFATANLIRRLPDSHILKRNFIYRNGIPMIMGASPTILKHLWDWSEAEKDKLPVGNVKKQLHP